MAQISAILNRLTSGVVKIDSSVTLILPLKRWPDAPARQVPTALEPGLAREPYHQLSLLRSAAPV